MDGFISTDLAARRFGVTPRTVRRWARRGWLPGAVYRAKAWHIPTRDEDSLYNAARQILDYLEGRNPAVREQGIADLRRAVKSCEQIRSEAGSRRGGRIE